MFVTAAIIGALVSAARAAVSELPPIPLDLSTPVQQRLAFQGPTGMSVAWNTYAAVKTPTVHYGLSPLALNLNVTSSSTHSVTYKTSRTWSNNVILRGLTPATTYYYKIGSTNSSIDSFVTGRPAGDMTSFTVAAVVDMGVFGKNGVTVSERSLIPDIDPSLEHTTIGALANAAGDYDFVIHPGDLAYADDWILGELGGEDPGTLLDGSSIYEALVEQFFNQLSAVSRMKPYMVSPGNHEADCIEVPLYPCASGQTNFTGFLNRYGNGFLPLSSASPLATTSVNTRSRKARLDDKASEMRSKRQTAASLANPPFWYSFDYGMTHFVMIDTETDLGKGLVGPEELGGSQGLVNGPFGGVNQQIDFLHADLSSVDRTLTPWVVVAGHRPWYTDGEVCGACQTAFEPIFLEYNVDAAVFGHIHNMQLIAPIANNKTDPAGLNNPTAPWYIINGAAGNIEGQSAMSSSPPGYITWSNDELYGFSKLIFHNRTNLEVQYINSDNGTVIHSAMLYKSH